MRKTLILSLLFALFPFSINSQTEAELFELYNACQPVKLAVEYLSEDAKKINLTREDIINLAELKLRSARIYKRQPKDNPYLYVQVTIVGESFSNEVEFKKQVMTLHGVSGMATTWEEGHTGRYGSASTGQDFVLSSVSKLLDKFIVEYLRANEKDCK